MNHDISSIVSGWDYDPNEVRARYIQANDGTLKIQLRLDLGVFQMELEGRPDGSRPKGFASLREYYIDEEARSPGRVLSYQLDVDACSELQQEAMQYYYRMMAYHALGDLAGVVRDSEQNLELIDIVSEYAQDDEIAWQFMQIYPYLRMMNVRAQAELMMQQNAFEQAERLVKETITDMEQFFLEYYEPLNEDGTPVPPPQEMVSLRELAEHIDRRRPRSEVETLKEAMAHAVELENYEKAAFLRDQLKALTGFAPRPGSLKRIRPQGGGGRENAP